MPHDEKRDYEVGYGKPPRHTRFTAGQSGNPHGRPSGSKNFAALVREVLNEQVLVAENGGSRKISKRLAIIKQLANRSIKADLRAIKMLIDIEQEIERRTEPVPSETSFGPAEEQVIEQLKARLRLMKGKIE